MHQQVSHVKVIRGALLKHVQGDLHFVIQMRVVLKSQCDASAKRNVVCMQVAAES